jgi:tetratricopeptide (TPR) repeat protein
LNEAIRLQPDVAAFYPIRAYLRLKRGDNEGSLVDANQAVSLLPNDPGPLISRGAIYMRMAMHDDALADFEQLIKLDPNRSVSYEMRGAARRALGDLDGALADFSQAIRRDKNRAPSYELRGLTHSAKREYRQAMDDHRAAIRLSPKTARYHFNLGVAASAAGSSSDLAAYTTAVELSPTNPRYLERRARALYYRHEYDAALDDLSKALASDEKFVRAYVTRSEVLRKRNDLDGAIRDLGRAIEIDTKFAYAHAVRGSIWREKGDFAKALADYDKAIDLDPKGSRPYRSRAWLRATCPEAEFRNGALAVADATKACEIEQWRNLDYISALAAAHGEAGEFDKAIERQQQALAKIGTTEKAEYERRLALFRERKPLRDTPGPETENGEMPSPADPTPVDNAAH